MMCVLCFVGGCLGWTIQQRHEHHRSVLNQLKIVGLYFVVVCFDSMPVLAFFFSTDILLASFSLSLYLIQSPIFLVFSLCSAHFANHIEFILIVAINAN